MTRRVRMLCLIGVCFSATDALAWSWRDLLQTPEQQARADLKAERFDALVNNPQLPQWQAVGQYRQGEFEQAAQQYESLVNAIPYSDAMPEATRDKWLSLRYNEATTLTQAGRYEDALARYDEVLSVAPDHESARHNREITRQLLEQQQQQSGEGEQDPSDQASDDSQSGQGDSSDTQQGSQDNSDDQSQSQPSEQSQENADAGSESDTDDTEQNAGEPDTQNQPPQDFSEMMANEPSTDDGGSADTTEVINVGEDIVSEDQQATEQWLRQIEDDPSGLLRRKLQRSHMTDHPTVRDSVTPW